MNPRLSLKTDALRTWITCRTASWLVPLVVALAGCGDGQRGPDVGSPRTTSIAGMDAGAQGGRTDSGSGGRGGGSQNGGAAPEGGEAGSTAGTAGSSSGGVGTSNGGPLGFSVPAQGQVLSAQSLAAQLVSYDPGSLLRCDVASDPNYQAAIDTLGGVTWGYNVGILEDLSQPRYLAGVERPLLAVPGEATAGGDASPVEIALPDVVAVTDSAALYYSTTHGLMIVGLDGATPSFHCATQLPGRVDQFFFDQGQLVVIGKSQDNRQSYLLHFKVDGTALTFVEVVALGPVDVLDSRRFNERLVFYTTLDLTAAATSAPGNSGTGSNAGPSGGASPAVPATRPTVQNNRALHVFRLGDTLEEELYDTLIDTSQTQDQLVGQVTDATPLGSEIYEAHSFGTDMWASDHYFVVTEQISKTYLDAWQTQNYSVCTASHSTSTPYTYCWTQYETRPNPDYVAPDNSGGDRACHGTTLSDCLTQVARVSNKTIQVPVGKMCEQRTQTNFFCDAYETRSTTYPIFHQEASTQLYIYAYTDSGFVQLDSKVHEVTNSGLDAVAADAQVDVITTSVDDFDLAVPGTLQTAYFQNGYLYVISAGVLQVYAMGDSSIVRTATLQVVNDTLQASLFSNDHLYLSDFGWSNGADHSTLRVINLQNPAFPTQDGATHQLPGGNRSIIAATAGIFTVGSVSQFMGQSVNALKLGLFSDPYADETAYLILGTDLNYTSLTDEKAQFWSDASQRLFLPYSGQDDQGAPIERVDVSQVVTGSIDSEGAVALPELAERIRPLPTGGEAYLTFAKNSIEWLTPDDQQQWHAAPVLEYFEPFDLYRRSGDADNVELERLGTRCRLYFADASNVNQRGDGAVYSDEFFCLGNAQAYDRRFVFSSTSGVEYADDHSVRQLSADEITDTLAKIAARPYCLLSLEYVDNPTLDPQSLPPLDRFTCLSPSDYNDLRNRLSMQQP
jgi:hypothetical protein